MQGGDIFDFARTGPLSFKEANEVVAILNRVTAKYSKKVNELIARLEALGPSEKEKTTEVELVINGLIEEWNRKVRQLGGLPKGLWLVDIDAGDGYYCWKFPETEVLYWHDYKSGYSGRIPVNERMKSRGPELVKKMDEIEAL